MYGRRSRGRIHEIEDGDVQMIHLDSAAGDVEDGIDPMYSGPLYANPAKRKRGMPSCISMAFAAPE